LLHNKKTCQANERNIVKHCAVIIGGLLHAEHAIILHVASFLKYLPKILWKNYVVVKEKWHKAGAPAGLN